MIEREKRNSYPLRGSALLLFFLLFLPVALFGDEVYLKGAGSLSGRIVDQTETTISIDVGGGTVGVPMSRVERIEKKRSPLDDYSERASKLGPLDADGWRQLGRWASYQGLSAQAREAYEKVLKIKPNDTEAREALGFVQLEGRWMTEEESYRARGYVRYGDEWVTPGEAQMLKANAAADEAAREAEYRAIQSDVAALKAELRADEEKERAEDEEWKSRNDPVYWGGWGYGLMTWPSTPPGGNND